MPNNKKLNPIKSNQNRSYFNELKLKGFRGYLNSTKIKFGKRLTLIFGKGSTGKSTILEAIKCLSASNVNDVDLSGLKTKHILSKRNKSKSFEIGFAAEDRGSRRGILKKFLAAGPGWGLFYPSQIDLFSFSEKTNDGKPLEKNRFASIENTNLPKELENSLGLKNLYMSKIIFADNEYAYKELFNEYKKYRELLIKRLQSCIKFSDKIVSLYAGADRNSLKIKTNAEKIRKLKEKIELASKKPNQTELNKLTKEINKLEAEIKETDKDIRKIDAERDNLFETVSGPGVPFNPTLFLFRKKSIVNDHIKFIESKNISLSQFVQYLANDVRSEKSYLYKNNKLYGREIRRDLNRSFTREERKYFLDFTTLLEFLCYEVSRTIVKDDPAFFPSKNHFQWSRKEPGKTLGIKSMFATCSDTFSSVLKKIRIIRHIEMEQMLANQFSQINLSNPHALIEENQKKINKWLEIFEYDFKVSVERSGLSDETEIVHRKHGHKIPASQGGSGAQYLLTFLSACLGYHNDILLIEEPEKGLHPSLQVKLAKFFVENSETNQLVIETHSENLLLGVLKSIRDKELKPEDIVINYVYMENGESKVDELKVDNKGNFLSKWRHGFFTERLDLL